MPERPSYPAYHHHLRPFLAWLRATATRVEGYGPERRAESQVRTGALIVVVVAAAFAVLPVVRSNGAMARASGERDVRAVASSVTGADGGTGPGGTGADTAAGDDPAGGAVAPAAPAPPASPPPAQPIVNPATRGALPVGKGMWIWQPEHTENGDVAAIVTRATTVGLTHLFVRTGSTFDGFYAQGFLDQLLPAAHAAGIRVYGWDVPYLDNDDEDIARAVAAITYTTPGGHRLDGFAADIEIGDGQNVTPVPAFTYGLGLRRAVGARYPLIACVPRPNPALVRFPFPEVVAAFDAIAPMVYWLGNDPGDSVQMAVAGLASFGKPILPVGQAYDGASEGGPPGVPSRDALLRFFQAGDAAGADGYSFWDWQEADDQAWDAIRDAPQGTLPAAAALSPGQARAYQVLVASLGFRTIADYQRAAHLPATGQIDEATRHLLLTPVAAPVHPS